MINKEPTPKKKKVNGKKKGNSYEREISNKFSERFKEVTGIEKSFRRNTDSGSFFGGQNKTRTEQYDLNNACFGDIMTPVNFKFTLECKSYHSAPTVASILKHNIKNWDEWIEQSESDAESANKKQFLVVKYNNIPEMVIIKDDLTHLGVNYAIQYHEYKVYNLNDILQLPDDFFFEIEDKKAED
ncbi:MAG: hypothetical protein [Caudoviricetes sp.]|nr:MAG: hypothetical protein [Caudoviricetes sp.]